MIWYSYGYRSADLAQDAMWDEIAEGRLSAADCAIRQYRTKDGQTRWGIKERAQ